MNEKNFEIKVEQEEKLQELLKEIALRENFDLQTIEEEDFIDENMYCDILLAIEDYLKFLYKKYGGNK